MISLAQLWLPILLSAVGVFIASSVLHMLLKFWHMPDYKGFPNEDEVREAVGRESLKPGIYTLPFCRMEEMNKPETEQKFEDGPVGVLMLQSNGMPKMGAMLSQWFAACLVVSIFVAYIATNTLAPGTDFMHVFRIVGATGFLAYGFASIPAGIWWGQPWSAAFKDVVDGLIYGLITAAVFAWLWPQAMGS